MIYRVVANGRKGLCPDVLRKLLSRKNLEARCRRP
jgi:hypothetical protein